MHYYLGRAFASAGELRTHGLPQHRRSAIREWAFLFLRQVLLLFLEKKFHRRKTTNYGYFDNSLDVAKYELTSMSQIMKGRCYVATNTGPCAGNMLIKMSSYLYKKRFSFGSQGLAVQEYNRVGQVIAESALIHRPSYSHPHPGFV